MSTEAFQAQLVLQWTFTFHSLTNRHKNMKTNLLAKLCLCSRTHLHLWVWISWLLSSIYSWMSATLTQAAKTLDCTFHFCGSQNVKMFFLARSTDLWSLGNFGFFHTLRWRATQLFNIFEWHLIAFWKALQLCETMRSYFLKTFYWLVPPFTKTF